MSKILLLVCAATMAVLAVSLKERKHPVADHFAKLKKEDAEQVHNLLTDLRSKFETKRRKLIHLKTLPERQQNAAEQTKLLRGKSRKQAAKNFQNMNVGYQPLKKTLDRVPRNVARQRQATMESKKKPRNNVEKSLKLASHRFGLSKKQAKEAFKPKKVVHL